ncbi:hypothetical protein Tco_0662331 [Tanacetum coccineum]
MSLRSLDFAMLESSKRVDIVCYKIVKGMVKKGSLFWKSRGSGGESIKQDYGERKPVGVVLTCTQELTDITGEQSDMVCRSIYEQPSSALCSSLHGEISGGCGDCVGAGYKLIDEASTLTDSRLTGGYTDSSWYRCVWRGAEVDLVGIGMCTRGQDTIESTKNTLLDRLDTTRRHSIGFEDMVKEKWTAISDLEQSKPLHTKLKDLKSHLKLWYAHTKEVEANTKFHLSYIARLG